MKIKVFFKDAFLGILEKRGESFVYNSSEEEKNAQEKYFLKISAYSEMLGSNNQKFNKLPTFFQEVVDQIKKRQDLIDGAKVLQTDEDFVVLAKYAMLDQFKQNFHFGVEN